MTRDVLEPEGVAALGRAMATRPLLAFDFDGTLAPLAVRPEDVEIAPSTTQALARLCAHAPCVVVSGRARATLSAKLARLPLAAVVGNHGLESTGQEPACREHTTWVQTLRREVEDLPGVWLEDKRLSVAVHYREATDRDAARRHITEVAHGLAGADVLSGDATVNILPAGAPGKGQALSRLQETHRCHTVLFIGDEETDEQAFKWGRTRGWCTVKVGDPRDTAARFYLGRQADIDLLLGLLLDSLSPGPDRLRVSS